MYNGDVMDKNHGSYRLDLIASWKMKLRTEKIKERKEQIGFSSNAQTLAENGKHCSTHTDSHKTWEALGRI